MFLNIQKYGLATEYTNNLSIGKLINYTFGVLLFRTQKLPDYSVEDFIKKT